MGVGPRDEREHGTTTEGTTNPTVRAVARRDKRKG
jgi:hypothetical protein